MSFKETVLKTFVDLLNAKIIYLENMLNDLKESAKNETKSTAGDKHETALAMLQIEQENIRKQLKSVQEQKISIEKINPLIVTNTVRLGSLVKTNNGYFFIAAGVGKITLNEQTIIALSPISPLGTKLMGKFVGENIQQNNIFYKIEKVD
jgi:hypothetical protein